MTICYSAVMQNARKTRGAPVKMNSRLGARAVLYLSFRFSLHHLLLGENILVRKLRRDIPYNIPRFAFSRLWPSPH